MKPEISVVIPTKNEEAYLEKTLKQYIPYKEKYEIEVIISDGGSTDKTLEIAKKYADKIVLQKKGVKQNIAIGRNAGAKVSEGKIIFETDADVIIPNKDKFFREIKKVFKDKNVSAATTKLKIYPEKEILKDKIMHLLINDSVLVSTKVGFIAGRGECQLIRASSFKKIKGYNESIIVGEDGNLFYRLKKVGKIVYLRNLEVYHSPRRFRKEGYSKVIFQYLREGIFLVLTGHSYLKYWKQCK